MIPRSALGKFRTCPLNVRFTPKTGRLGAQAKCLRRATTGLMHRSSGLRSEVRVQVIGQAVQARVVAIYAPPADGGATAGPAALAAAGRNFARTSSTLSIGMPSDLATCCTCSSPSAVRICSGVIGRLVLFCLSKMRPAPGGRRPAAWRGSTVALRCQALF
jgi:hypothetical protein